MLECRLTQAALLKKIVEALRELVTDAQLEFSDSGLQLQAMDSSHVSLCHLKLDKDGFDHYRCDKNTMLGVSLPNLAKVLKLASNEDTLTLKAKEDGDVMSLMFESKDQDKLVDLDLTLMDLDQEQLQIPETEYQADILIPADEFKRIIADLLALGDTCTISAKKEGVRFTVNGDVGRANITLKPGQAADDDDRKTTINVEEPVELRFALRYLNYFAKATPLASQVKLSLNKDVPLLVQYKMGDDIGAMSYYLAPKIDDDEEA